MSVVILGLIGPLVMMVMVGHLAAVLPVAALAVVVTALDEMGLSVVVVVGWGCLRWW